MAAPIALGRAQKYGQFTLRLILYEAATDSPFGLNSEPVEQSKSRADWASTGSARTVDKGRYCVQLHTEMVLPKAIALGRAQKIVGAIPLWLPRSHSRTLNYNIDKQQIITEKTK